MPQFSLSHAIRKLFQGSPTTAVGPPPPDFRTPEELARERHGRLNMAHLEEFAVVLRCAETLKEREPALATFLDSTDLGGIRLFVLTFLARQEENWHDNGISVRVPHPENITWEEALARFVLGQQIADNPSREEELRALNFDERRALVRSLAATGSA